MPYQVKLTSQIWSNYDVNESEQSTKALAAKLALVLVCFVNTIPLLIITFLTNLDAVSQRSEILKMHVWRTDWRLGHRKSPRIQESGGIIRHLERYLYYRSRSRPGHCRRHLLLLLALHHAISQPVVRCIDQRTNGQGRHQAAVLLPRRESVRDPTMPE